MIYTNGGFQSTECETMGNFQNSEIFYKKEETLNNQYIVVPFTTVERESMLQP